MSSAGNFQIYTVEEILGNVHKFKKTLGKTKDGNWQGKLSMPNDGSDLCLRIGSYEEPLWSFFGTKLSPVAQEKMPREQLESKRSLTYSLPVETKQGQDIHALIREIDQVVYEFISSCDNYWEPVYARSIKTTDMSGKPLSDDIIAMKKQTLQETAYRPLLRRFAKPTDEEKLRKYISNYGDKDFPDSSRINLNINPTNPHRTNFYKIVNVYPDPNTGDIMHDAAPINWTELDDGKVRFFAEVTLRPIYFMDGRYGITVQANNIFVVPSNFGNANQVARDINIVPRESLQSEQQQQQQQQYLQSPGPSNSPYHDGGGSGDYNNNNNNNNNSSNNYGNASPMHNGQQGASFIPPDQHNNAYQTS